MPEHRVRHVGVTLLVGAAAFSDDPELFGAYAELGIDIYDPMSFAGPDRRLARAEEFMADAGVESEVRGSG